MLQPKCEACEEREREETVPEVQTQMTAGTPDDPLVPEAQAGAEQAAAPRIQLKEEGPPTAAAPQPITDPEVLAGERELIPEDEPEREFVDYAFFYTGGGYGNSARRFFDVFYPDHVKVRAASFEEMFDRMYADLLRFEREGRRVEVRELVIVTHANAAGGLQIPLARDDVPRKRNFTPWDLATLQEEFRDRTNRAFRRRQRFRQRRAAVVSRFLGPNTDVVVRGCRFGQSQDGLDALRSFFGGNINVWAPRGFQGYQVAGIGTSHLATAEEAFDMLQAQGMLPEDMKASPEEKRKYLKEELGIRGAVPSEFFVMGEKDYKDLQGLIQRKRGLSEEAEKHITREEVGMPTSDEFWGSSMRGTPRRDPELDRLSLEEIERRARILKENYQPSYAPMLMRLREVWGRHPERLRRSLEPILKPELRTDDYYDPLGGMPTSDMFGSPSAVPMDAARYRTPPLYDTFEDETLPFAPPVEGAEAAARYDEGLGAMDAAAIAADDAAAQKAARGGATPGEAQPGGAPSGETQRRRPTAKELAAARDFSKSETEPAQPEKPPEPTLEELLQALSTDPGILAILATLPEEGWKLSDYLAVAELSVTGVTAIPTIIGAETFLGLTAFAWELIALAGPILSIAGFIAALDEAADSQANNAQAKGVELGLNRMLWDVGSDSPHDVDRWIKQLRNHFVYRHDMYWLEAARYPLSEERLESNFRTGLKAVADGSDRTVKAAVERIRAHLRQRGMPESQLEQTLLASHSRIRRVVLVALYQSGQRALNERRKRQKERDERD